MRKITGDYVRKISRQGKKIDHANWPPATRVSVGRPRNSGSPFSSHVGLNEARIVLIRIAPYQSLGGHFLVAPKRPAQIPQRLVLRVERRPAPRRWSPLLLRRTARISPITLTAISAGESAPTS